MNIVHFLMKLLWYLDLILSLCRLSEVGSEDFSILILNENADNSPGCSLCSAIPSVRTLNHFLIGAHRRNRCGACGNDECL